MMDNPRVSHAPTHAHLLTVRTDKLGRDTYEHPASGTSATHATDALSRLLRALVAQGLIGPAEVRSTADGSLRFTVPAIERTARRMLVEDDQGLRWTRHKPMPVHLTKAGGRTSRRQPAEVPASALALA